MKLVHANEMNSYIERRPAPVIYPQMGLQRVLIHRLLYLNFVATCRDGSEHDELRSVM